jgi:hypothetical protein
MHKLLLLMKLYNCFKKIYEQAKLGQRLALITIFLSDHLLVKQKLGKEFFKNDVVKALILAKNENLPIIS